MLQAHSFLLLFDTSVPCVQLTAFYAHFLYILGCAPNFYEINPRAMCPPFLVLKTASVSINIQAVFYNNQGNLNTYTFNCQQSLLAKAKNTDHLLHLNTWVEIHQTLLNASTILER